MEFFTIGVYNSDERFFFKKLTDNNIDTFCDIRQRRGVRGSKYSFVNSNRLQQKLKELGIQYGHFLSLAPTSEIRDIQKKMDVEKGELKSRRLGLGLAFILNYEKDILGKFDFSRFLESLESSNAKKVVLFCVEEQAEACHRSIVAKELKEKYSYKITHL